MEHFFEKWGRTGTKGDATFVYTQKILNKNHVTDAHC